jgi:hypothetical protein
MSHRVRLSCFSLFSALLLAGCQAASDDTGAPPSDYEADLGITPRFQWSANFGYCGETSFVSAALHYGAYLSQYDARAYASEGMDQSLEESQLLVGVNADVAAARLHLESTSWSDSGAEDFLAWVKQNVVAGNPVILGVYTNEWRFDDDPDPWAGSDEYDHVVPVMSVGSDYALTDAAAEADSEYHDDDTITFSDNGLLGDDTPEGSEYYFRYSFADFPMTRDEANDPDAPWYALASEAADYGIAITGVTDAAGDTLPVQVETSVNYEEPAMEEGSSTRPESSPVTLTVQVSGLSPGTDYVLYRYDDVDVVPDSAFNAHASAAARSWPVRIDSGSTFTVTETIESSDVAVYRAVQASAD